MKKAKQLQFRNDKLSPEEVLTFLEDYRELLGGVDTKSKLISLRVPSNVLSVFKKKAVLNNQKYQSIIVSLMRDWIKE